MKEINPRPGAKVLYRERAFHPDSQVFTAREGLTIAEIVNSSEIKLPRLFQTRGIVLIGKDEVPRERWHLVKPKPSIDGRVDVSLALRLSGGASGGGGGSKNTLMMVAQIAVFAATLFIGFGGFSLLAGAAFKAGTIGAALLAGAVSIGGSLAIAGLSKTPSIDNGVTPQEAAATLNDSAQQGTASASGNAIGPGDPVPRVYGTSDCTPQLLCPPLQEIIGIDEYVEAIFGLAGPHQISNIRIDGVPIDTIPNLTYQVIEGKPGDGYQTLITRGGMTVEPQISISRPQNDPVTPTNVLDQLTPANSLPQWHGFTSRKAPDEFWAVVGWNQALVDLSASGTSIGVPVRVRFRQKGTLAWRNLPEVHFSSKAGTPFAKHFKFIWSAKPLIVPLAPSEESAYLALAFVPPQTIAPASGGWTADPYFYTSGTSYYSAATYGTHTITGLSLSSDGVEVYLDPSIFPRDFYEFQISAGNIYTKSSFSQTSTYLYSGVVYDFYGFYLSGTIATYARTRATVNDAMSLIRVSSIKNTQPVTSTDFALLAIRAKNMSISNVVMLASGYTYDWDAAKGEWTNFTISSNPAPHWVDCMTNLIELPIPIDVIDSAAILSWRQACIDNNYQVNAVFVGKTLKDVADTIAGSGYARSRFSEKWGVVQDRDRSAEAPVQTFGPRNLISFHVEKAFPIVPSGLRVTYRDKFDNYLQREVVVLRALSPIADDGVYQKIQYDTFVTEAEAIQRAKFDLGQLTERPTFYKGTAPLEFLSSIKGDLVAVAHDILDNKAGFAYVSTVTYDTSVPPKITGFVLDGTIPVSSSNAWSGTAAAWSGYSSAFAAPRYGVLIRKKDQSNVTVEFTATTDPATVITLATPMVDPGTITVDGKTVKVIDTGCLIASGKLSREYLRLLVLDITPKEDLTADMTWVDEAPQLFVGGQPI